MRTNMDFPHSKTEESYTRVANGDIKQDMIKLKCWTNRRHQKELFYNQQEVPKIWTQFTTENGPGITQWKLKLKIENQQNVIQTCELNIRILGPQQTKDQNFDTKAK